MGSQSPSEYILREIGESFGLQQYIKARSGLIEIPGGSNEKLSLLLPACHPLI